MEWDEAMKLAAERSPRVRGVVEKLAKWDGGKTLAENAEALGVTMGSARVYSSRYGLPFRHLKSGVGVKPNEIRRNAMRVLREEKGWAPADIAAAFGVTPQAVREAIMRAAVSDGTR